MKYEESRWRPVLDFADMALKTLLEAWKGWCLAGGLPLSRAGKTVDYVLLAMARRPD